jgi:DcmR-like sensory protein
MGVDKLSGRGRVTSGPRERFRSGIDGIDLESGDHICCFYSGLDERDRILLSYLRAGVRDSDKCVCAPPSPAGSTCTSISPGTAARARA